MPVPRNLLEVLITQVALELGKEEARCKLRLRRDVSTGLLEASELPSKGYIDGEYTEVKEEYKPHQNEDLKRLLKLGTRKEEGHSNG